MAETKVTKLETEVAEAAVMVLDARQVLAKWRGRVVDARAALAETEAVTGDELLDDEERAAEWPAKVRELGDHVAAAAHAAEAQEVRVRTAEMVWCHAQATLLEASEVAPARRAVRAHQNRTAELLAALEEHDGPYVTQHELAQAQRSHTGVLVQGAVPLRLPKNHVLKVAVARAEVRHSVLATMAKGEDPTVLVVGRPYASEISEAECYPEAVGLGGLVPAPVYAARAASAQEGVADLVKAVAELEQEIARAEEEVRMGMRTPGSARTVIAWNRARLDEIPVELDAARGQLAALTGQTQD